MNELKKRRITVELTDEELFKLRQLSEIRETTVNKLLSQFIADLTYSDRSGGSDERAIADEWLSRSIYNFF